MHFNKANCNFDLTIQNLNNFVLVIATKTFNFAWKIFTKTFSYKKIVATKKKKLRACIKPILRTT